MNNKQFNIIWREALKSPDGYREVFISDWTSGSIFEEDEDLSSLSEDVAKIWDIAHTSVKEIRAKTGLSQIKFCERFCIPRRTLEDWERGISKCPDYTRLMLVQLVGLYKRT